MTLVVLRSLERTGFDFPPPDGTDGLPPAIQRAIHQLTGEFWSAQAMTMLERLTSPACQGCSTLFTEGHRKYGFETAESGGVAVLRDCVGLIEPENIVGEASNSREDARIFSNARCVFA